MFSVKSDISDLPFKRGTYIIPSTSTDSIWSRVGQIYTIPDDRFPGQYVSLMVVKNELGTPGAVLPGIGYEFSTTAGEYLKKLGQIGSNDGTAQYIVDDLLPAAGAPDGSLLYVILSGSAYCKTLASAAEGNLWTIGALIYGAANGRAQTIASPSATQVARRLGVAEEVSTSAEASTTKKVFIGKQVA